MESSKKAGKVEEPWKIGALRDRIENIKMGWITDKLLDKNTTLDAFWNNHIRIDRKLI